jgi:hypothetical protein
MESTQEASMKKPLLISVLVVAGIAVLAALFVSAGLYDVAADEEHSSVVLRHDDL